MSRAGLRMRLVLLALTSMLPMFLLATGTTLHYVSREEEEIRNRGLQLARLTADDIDQEIAVTRAMLSSLSVSRSFDARDYAQLYQEAEEAAKRYGMPIGFIDASGRRIFNTYVPFETPLPPHPLPDLVRKALDTRTWQVSNQFPAHMRGDHAVIVLEPVFRRGVLAGLFGIEIDLNRVLEHSAAERLPADWIASVVDGNGLIVGRTHAADLFIGTPVTPRLLAAIAQNGEGSLFGTTKEGIPVLTTYTATNLAPWTVILGVPETVVEAPMWHSLSILVVAGIGLSAVGVGLALMIARSIGRPVLALADAAAALGRGERTPDSPLRSGLAEADRVGAVLWQAGHDLDRRARERDAAEQRVQTLQAELLHATRLSAMGQVVSTIAHEINQPLAAVSNYLEAGRMLLDNGGYAEAGSTMDRALEQADRATRIIQRIRDFAAKRGGGWFPETVEAIVDEACTLALLGMAGDEVELTVRVSADCPRVLVDRVQAQQVLVNLVRNAAEATAGQPRRTVTVIARPTSDTPPMVKFCVQDNGGGLSPTVRERLFTPFFTTKASGLGIGLAISRTIVDAHGGRLWCDHDDPAPEGAATTGARFHFTLPAATLSSHPLSNQTESA